MQQMSPSCYVVDADKSAWDFMKKTGVDISVKGSQRVKTQSQRD